VSSFRSSQLPEPISELILNIDSPSPTLYLTSLRVAFKTLFKRRQFRPGLYRRHAHQSIQSDPRRCHHPQHLSAEHHPPRVHKNTHPRPHDTYHEQRATLVSRTLRSCVATLSPPVRESAGPWSPQTLGDVSREASELIGVGIWTTRRLMKH
jgi:hypothetical protein